MNDWLTNTQPAMDATLTDSETGVVWTRKKNGWEPDQTVTWPGPQTPVSNGCIAWNALVVWRGEYLS